jgi:signal transduction histidine kinase/ActR/RegA family two-component response regulator
VAATASDTIDRATVRWFRDGASHGIFTTDETLRIRGWNRWLTAATGIPEGSAVGRTLPEVLPSFIERGFHEYYTAALSGTVTVLSYSLHRFILPIPPDAPRTQTPQSGRISPLWDGDRVVGTITIIEDVGERVATERELRAQIAVSEAARRTAEAASRVKDEFLATLSHEIRTPLNAVLGWTRILRSREIDTETLKRAIDVIDRNASAQLTLIGDMLDMSRIATGKLRLEVAPVDMEPITLSAVDVIRPAAEAKNLRVMTDLSSQIPPVMGDSDRLVQVIWNLLSNAVKFTPRGGAIIVALRADEGNVSLTVSDTGQGIDPSFVPQVFERFKQADPSSARRHGGLGLGLALVRELVELHGGSVRVASPGIGQGTTFTVQLPATVEGMIATSPVRSAISDAASSLEGIRVLIIEDEEDAREILTRSVSDFGAEVTAVGSVADALERLRTPEAALPHVILSDIGMPEADGYVLLRALRQLPREHGGDVPAIAVTAYTTPSDRKQALAAGFREHLEKPVAPLALAAAIARVTGGGAPAG